MIHLLSHVYEWGLLSSILIFGFFIWVIAGFPPNEETTLFEHVLLLIILGLAWPISWFAIVMVFFNNMSQ